MWYPALVEARDGTPREDPMARARSLSEFQSAFPDEASCAAFLFERRWPDGFVCPACGNARAAALRSRAYTYECYGCGRQTSITAGTAMHRTRLPLTAWFWAAHLMSTHSNGMSARQLEDQLGLTYRTAWLLAQKLRRSMVDPDREPLEGVVEVDQAEIPFREGDTFFDPGNAGKILVIGAVEVIERDTNQGKPRRKHAKYLDTRSGRIRLAMIANNSAASIEAFVKTNVKRGTTLITDGHPSFPGLSGDYRHDLRRKHVDTYLEEFVFRYNRRFYRHVSFETLLGIASHHQPVSYWDIAGHANPRKGEKTVRRAPRHRKTATGMRRDRSATAQNPPAESENPLHIDEHGTTG